MQNDNRRRNEFHDDDFNFTTAQLDAAAEVLRSRHSGPTSDTDIGQWNRETFQAALKAACKIRDGIDEAGNVRQTAAQAQKTA
jgi:hypothetical protein